VVSIRSIRRRGQIETQSQGATIFEIVLTGFSG